MVALHELSAYLASYLACDQFADYAPNGIQVEGRENITRIVTGVTACRLLLERAVEQRADAVLVHHGYFWKGEDPRLVDIKKQRLEILLRHGMSLLAYHLPLDVHAEIGNNAQFGLRMGWRGAALDRQGLLWTATLDNGVTPSELSDQLCVALARRPTHVASGRQQLRRIVWCTGAAQKYLPDAARAGADAFISGEISEQTTHEAREWGVDYFAAGHHATECFGVAALGAKLAQQFALHHVHIDIENPA